MGDVRSGTELASMRAAADARLQDPTWTRYPDEVVRVRAILSALDWLEGGRPDGPSSGELREPDEVGVRREMRHAVSEEDVYLRRRGSVDEATRHGAIGHALSWYLRRQFTEAPL